MSYYITTTLNESFENAYEKTLQALKNNGFGVLSEINVHEKFKEKLGKDFRKYRILGACSPAHAFRALTAEDKIGTMLPCNVVLQEHGPKTIEVSAIDPIASMQAVQNEGLGDVATEVKSMLAQVIDDLSGASSSD